MTKDTWILLSCCIIVIVVLLVFAPSSPVHTLIFTKGIYMNLFAFCMGVFSVAGSVSLIVGSCFLFEHLTSNTRMVHKQSMLLLKQEMAREKYVHDQKMINS